MAWLENKRASGDVGLEDLLSKARLAGSGRVFLIGDFFDLEPTSLARIQRPGRELCLIRVLAQSELVPTLCESVELVDPESGDKSRIRIDANLQSDYELELSKDLERWRTFTARHRIASGCWSSETPFEDIVRTMLSSA